MHLTPCLKTVGATECSCSLKQMFSKLKANQTKDIRSSSRGTKICAQITKTPFKYLNKL